MQVCTCVCIVMGNWLFCIRPDGNKKKKNVEADFEGSLVKGEGAWM